MWRATLHARLRASHMLLLTRLYGPSTWTGCPWEVQVAPSKSDERVPRGEPENGCSLAPATGLARPGPSLPVHREFHLSCTYISRLSRVQVSADYSSGSCESDFVVVVTSNSRGARFLPEQNRSLCMKFLITVLDSHKLLLIRYHYNIRNVGIYR